MIRFDRIRLAAVSMLLAAAPAATVLWAPARQPERAQGAAVLTAKLPRTRLVGSSTFERPEPVLVRWTAATVAVGAIVGIDMTGARWTVVVEMDDTLEDVRDRMLAALLPAAEFTGIAISEAGTDAIDLSANSVPGLLWRPVAIGGSTVAVTTSVDAQVTTGTVRGELEIQAYADGRGLEAHELLGRVISGLASADLIALRDRWGVALGRAGDLIDLTALAGADWQSRAVVRIPVSVRSYRAIALLPITEVHYAASFNPGSIAGSVTT